MTGFIAFSPQHFCMLLHFALFLLNLEQDVSLDEEVENACAK